MREEAFTKRLSELVEELRVKSEIIREIPREENQEKK